MVFWNRGWFQNVQEQEPILLARTLCLKSMVDFKSTLKSRLMYFMSSPSKSGLSPKWARTVFWNQRWFQVNLEVKVKFMSYLLNQGWSQNAPETPFSVYSYLSLSSPPWRSSILSFSCRSLWWLSSISILNMETGKSSLSHTCDTRPIVRENCIW